MSFRLEIEAVDGKARAGRMVTPHGVVETPVFMPVGTLGTVKAEVLYQGPASDGPKGVPLLLGL
jgi:hypothetical protein